MISARSTVWPSVVDEREAQAAAGHYRLVLDLPRVPAPLGRDEITLQESGRILGCGVSTVRRLVVTAHARHGGQESEARLSRHSVEMLATEVYSWRTHLGDASSYWVTGNHAAAVLGVSRARLSQLSAERRVPFVRHQDGTRLYRRAQLKLIASSGSLQRRRRPSSARAISEASKIVDGA